MNKNKWKQNNPEKVKMHQQKYRQSEKGRLTNRNCIKRWQINNRERQKELSRKWKQNNPEKVKAENILISAVHNGKIIPEPCLVCGEQRTHGHHPDYSLPLSVIWLCVQHHKDVHLGKITLP